MTLKKKRPAPASFQGNAKCKADAAIEKLQPLQITKSARNSNTKTASGTFIRPPFFSTGIYNSSPSWATARLVV
jgi:hypothetical protein